jgi:hypothetical protein
LRFDLNDRELAKALAQLPSVKILAGSKLERCLRV